MRVKKQHYILGNILRGFFEGRFASQDEAWKFLSRRFLMSFPARRGRHVSMWVQETHYGIKQNVVCKEGYTWCGHKPRRSVLRLCRPSWVLFKP